MHDLQTTKKQNVLLKLPPWGWGCLHVTLEKAEEADEYIGEEDHKIYRSVCGRLQFASPRKPDLLFTLKELGRGLARPMKSHWQLMKHLMRYLRGSTETVLVHMSERTETGVIKAQADSDWAGCHSTRKTTSCGMIWWSGVLITSYARTQSTIATSSAENASSATSMGSRVGLGKARHVAMRHLWLQQLVADKTIRFLAANTPSLGNHPPWTSSQTLKSPSGRTSSICSSATSWPWCWVTYSSPTSSVSASNRAFKTSGAAEAAPSESASRFSPL
eukprot:605459-Amphidinium_carterae.1